MQNSASRYLKFFVSFSFFASALCLLIYFLNYHQLAETAPLLYQHSWGVKQLASKRLLPLPLLVAMLSFLLFFRARKTAREAFFAWAILLGASFGNLLASFAVLRIIDLSTTNSLYIPFINRHVGLSLVIAFAISFLATPGTIRLANYLRLVDDPKIRKHPAMLQKRSIPRAGALPIFLGFAVSILLSVPLTKPVLGILLGSLLALLIGLADDRLDLSPYLRFFVGNLAVAGVVIGAGIGIAYFKLPFLNLTVDLGAINFSLGSHQITVLADIFDLIWIVWVMNMLNWSKGVDGQFPGIVIISALVLGILSLRIAPTDPSQLILAQVAFSAIGATFAFLIFNWYPSKILPGYGTTFLGLTLATLSIYSGAKIAIAILVLLVPTLDALAAILRRILRGQSPFWHDREHLHHRLLNRGWNHQQISYFYWFVTALCGAIALFTAGRQRLLAFLVVGGIASFAIAFLNLRKIWSTR